ncbi:MAG TPA: hypothetical protein VHT05_07050 [Candidatus Elarobacter sp.]|nr:hypothetical protein [Candidatus Elarobacter sp.]
MTVPKPLLWATLLLCAACSGGASGGVTTTPSPAQPLSASPSSVTIGVPSNTAVVNVSNATGPVTAKLDNPLLASLSVNGSTVTVVPIAAGQGTITIASGSASTSVPLSIGPCAPPNPYFSLATPASSATGVSTSLTTIVLALQSANTYTTGTIVSSVIARVVSSSGTDVVTAAQLHVASAPPGAPAGQYFSFAIPGLPAQSSYTVQTYLLGDPCLPESSVDMGTFST